VQLALPSTLPGDELAGDLPNDPSLSGATILVRR
jgi:hypothetical protein